MKEEDKEHEEAAAHLFEAIDQATETSKVAKDLSVVAEAKIQSLMKLLPKNVSAEDVKLVQQAGLQIQKLLKKAKSGKSVDKDIRALTKQYRPKKNK